MISSVWNENVVIITGASAGIGRALVLNLAQQGAWLVLAARDQSRLQELALECEKLGGQALVAPTDVSDRVQCKNMIDAAIHEFGRIDTLINNAGITMYARFDEIKEISFVEKIIQVNYLGSVYPSFYALPYLKESRGRLVGISSLTGKNGVPTRSAYAGSKHAQAGFFDSLRIELDEAGVSVTMIYPGFVATEIRQRAFGPDGQRVGQSHIREKNVMSAERCASIIVKAAAKRKREVVMTAKAKVAQWVKLVAPKLIDNFASKTIKFDK